MLSAGPDNAMYKTHAEASAEFVKALLTGLQVVAELQLKPRVAAKGPGSKGPYGKLGLERDVYEAAVKSCGSYIASSISKRIWRPTSAG